MHTHVRFISLLAFVSAPLMAGCIDPTGGGGSVEGDTTSGAGGAGNASAGGSAPGGAGGEPTLGGAGGEPCGAWCAVGGRGGEAAGGRGEGGRGEGGAGGADTGTGSDTGTGTDTGTGSDTGTGTDTGTGSDTGTGTDTGTGSGGAGGAGGSSGEGGAGGAGEPPPAAWDACPGLRHGLASTETFVVDATTERLNDDHYSFCGDLLPSAEKNDAVYAFVIEEAATVRVHVDPINGSTLDPAVYIGSDCENIEYCLNFGVGEAWKAHRDAGAFVVVVDSANAHDGEFRLTVEVAPPACGDGVVNPGEACDPGAAAANDGCHDPGTVDECQIEVGAVEKDVCPGEPVSVPAGSMMLSRDDGHTTIGYNDDYDSNVCGSFLGLDRVYELVPQVDGLLTVTVGLDAQGNAICVEDVADLGCWDYVMYVRTDCGDAQTEIGCSDQWWDTPETMTFPVVAGTPYYVIVDGYDEWFWSQGPYNLTIELN